MDGGSQNFDVAKCTNYLAYRVLMDVPKFSDVNAAVRDNVENESEEEEEDEGEVEILKSSRFNSEWLMCQAALMVNATTKRECAPRTPKFKIKSARLKC
jgi:hypothetical protein